MDDAFNVVEQSAVRLGLYHPFQRMIFGAGVAAIGIWLWRPDWAFDGWRPRPDVYFWNADDTDEDRTNMPWWVFPVIGSFYGIVV